MKQRSKANLTALLGMLAVFAVTAGCQKEAAKRGVPEVATVTLRSERVVLNSELPGRTAPYGVAEIRPQVSGIIQKRLFQEGSDVQAGSLLYQIDPAPYQAAFEQSKAALALAEATLPALRSRAERLKGLASQHAAGQQDSDDAEAAVRQAEAHVAAAQAAMESARINLSYTPIAAPISGRTGKSSVTVGALVTAYQQVSLVTIQQLDPIYVDVPQATAEMLRMRRNGENGQVKPDSEGQRRVRLVLEDGTAYPLEGTLQFRDVTVDQTTGSVTLRMVFPNPDHILLPGMFVRAIVEEGVSDQGLLVPQPGVLRDPKGNPIALVVTSENKVEQRKLVLDRAIGDRWLVSKGLAPGDNVIVEGSLKVRAGDTVRSIQGGAASSTGKTESSTAAK